MTTERDFGTALCLYCGFVGQRMTLAEARIETLEHGRTCQKHPMREIERENAALRAEIRRLRALDSHGVPDHPPGTHGEHGCRIGDRMDWLITERDRLLEVIGKWARVGHPIMDAIEGTPLGSMGTDPEPFVRRIEELKAAERERDEARKAILSFGNNPAGFDWAVLGKIDELETDNAALRAEVERWASLARANGWEDQSE